MAPRVGFTAGCLPGILRVTRARGGKVSREMNAAPPETPPEAFAPNERFLAFLPDRSHRNYLLLLPPSASPEATSRRRATRQMSVDVIHRVQKPLPRRRRW